MSDALAVVPTYVAQPIDIEVINDCLTSLRRTEPDLDCLVVDDGSPARELLPAIRDIARDCSCEFIEKKKNEGFSKTVNVGLRRALTEGRDAILVNADLEFIEPGWAGRMAKQAMCEPTGEHELASVVGALLLYPTGLIQHAGVYFSMLGRCFEHVYKCAPGDLPEAQWARVCPVTGALQFIRHECLQAVGLYDERFLLGWEDMDYCLRVFNSGRECVYQPTVRAYHHESLFRGRPSPKVKEWQVKSLAWLWRKHSQGIFTDWVPHPIYGFMPPQDTELEQPAIDQAPDSSGLQSEAT